MPNFTLHANRNRRLGAGHSGLPAIAMFFVLLFGGLWVAWRFAGPEAGRAREDRAVDVDRLRLPAGAKEFKAGQEAYAAGRFAEAVQHWQASLQRIQNIPGTRRRQAMCYHNMGDALRRLERYEQALRMYKEAERIYRGDSDARLILARCCQSMAGVLLRLGRHEEAGSMYAAALSCFEEIPGTEREQAVCLVDMGVAFRRIGLHMKATQCWLDALPLFHKAGAPLSDQAACLVNCAAVAVEVDRHEEALGLYEAALEIYRESPGKDWERVGCVLNMGAVLSAMGSDEEVVEVFDEALAQLAGIEDTRAKNLRLRCHAGEGMALVDMARYEEAINVLTRALALCETAPSNGSARAIRAACNRSMAAAHLGMRHYDAALARLEEAMSIWKTIRGHEWEQGACLASIAGVYRRMDRLDDAVVSYRDARKYGFAPEVCVGFAQVLEKKGSQSDFDEALRGLVAAVSGAERFRAKHRSWDARIMASARAGRPYRYLARFLVNRSHDGWEPKGAEVARWMSSRQPRLRCLEAAFHYADMSKAVAQTERIRQRSLKIAHDPRGQALLDEDRQLLAQIGAAHERKLALPHDAKASHMELDDQIAVLSATTFCTFVREFSPPSPAKTQIQVWPHWIHVVSAPPERPVRSSTVSIESAKKHSASQDGQASPC